MRKDDRSTALVRLASLAALGFLAAGCGGGGTAVSTPEDEPAPAPETELTITVSTEEDGAASDAPSDAPSSSPSDGAAEEWTLTCSPAGGDHPDPETACADLEEAGAEPFAEVSADQMCTHIFGGPEVATVSGHVGDTEIDTEFSKSGGCEIARYEDMGAVLTP
ncbi:SSI family serine proteinase inhibitor [Nocardiopsis sediminis]|uniref:SSI family serine proteinase inhibitor n=1 Tax=Nocardiopsis sediminis TaxID=1778267 RepID=A0ABV8FVG8_9ACTN